MWQYSFYWFFFFKTNADCREVVSEWPCREGWWGKVPCESSVVTARAEAFFRSNKNKTRNCPCAEATLIYFFLTELYSFLNPGPVCWIPTSSSIHHISLHPFSKQLRAPLPFYLHNSPVHCIAASAHCLESCAANSQTLYFHWIIYLYSAFEILSILSGNQLG